jgi:TolB-like protein/AraC-like DNA-binding protein/Tfp pilus assembly protein PilF
MSKIDISKPLYQETFIEKAEAIIQDHLSNEQFGVSELAELMHMSRSSLLRNIKKHTGGSASQFIRQVRLQKAMEFLQDTELSVSEISFEVGFGNPSYFIKCFREEYGYPPGEVRKPLIDIEESAEEFQQVNRQTKTRSFQWPIIISFFVIICLGFILLYQSLAPSKPSEATLEKSIAVLPFKNMSNDSTNLYFVNGLMESALTNLQKIGDLRVISRTSVEKYRYSDKSISEIAEELNVNYLVEGSGQKVGDQIMLNIQLIEASSDTPLWAEQYKHEVVDIFSLQNTIAKKIADAIQATVTPDELQQIEKKPTNNLLAYDFYLKGMEAFKMETREGLEESILWFNKAIEEDPTFATAYSKLVFAYYYLDYNQTEKQYTEIINNYADKALLYDPKSAESLIAKAVYYTYNGDFRLAVPHLEKALEYNPNSSGAVQFLGDFYARVIPDTGKYLKYALKGVQLDIEANDSVAKSYIYLHLSNALIQNGFVTEAQKYIDLSLDYNAKNYYAPFLKVFINYADHQDIKKATKQLVDIWRMDTTRLDIIQEVGKFYYFQKQYDSAYYYYNKFVEAKLENGLDIYPQEDLKIGLVYDKMGIFTMADSLFKAYDGYVETDESIYKSASLATKYAREVKPEQAIEQLRLFSTQNNYQYWIVLFLDKDPVMETLKSHPEFKLILQKIEDRFWDKHNELKQSLEKNKLL